MKKLFSSLTIIVCFVLIAVTANAQQSQNGAISYQFAAGLKFGGYENGVSGKWFNNENTSLEGELGFRDHGVVVTGLYEINQEAFNVPELKFYYGFGAHIGGVGRGYYHRFDGDAEYFDDSHLLLGADGVIGLEYMIPKSPIAISLDLNPRIEIATGPYFDIAPGIGVKYMFF
jgi:hypothetical protein